MALQLNISFKLTAHAKKRIYQRNITPPNADTLKTATTKIKKAIRNSCKYHGYKKDHIYLTSVIKPNVKTTVYVCEVIEATVYKVITAFKLPLKKY